MMYNCTAVIVTAQTCSLQGGIVEHRIFSLNWLAAIAPEASLVPGANVFEGISQEMSLTAIGSEQPGLLFISPDMLIECVQRGNDSLSTK